MYTSKKGGYYVAFTAASNLTAWQMDMKIVLSVHDDILQASCTAPSFLTQLLKLHHNIQHPSSPGVGNICLRLSCRSRLLMAMEWYFKIKRVYTHLTLLRSQMLHIYLSSQRSTLTFLYNIFATLLVPYVLSLKCSRNHFFPPLRNTKKIQSLKLHFLQNSPLVQLYSSVSDCKGVRNIPGSHFVKPFQLFRRILNYVSSTTKVPSLQCWFESRKQVKFNYSHVRRVWWMFQCCHIVPR